ncbi:MAG TPA: acyl-CoA dehydrogenase family protein [Solirubrobacteraceae bacterium]|jgi:alkylation response protein AidB-like acyl-CoA dehydrogenase|nr:acyl-CoA dehydrogenase family protein [Solirubrobacteraceae bacterium]
MAVSERQRAEELLERTETLVPLLRASARDAEREGRVAARCLEAIADAGVFKMTAPIDAGGYQLPVTTQVDVLAALARGCGSTSWVCAVYSVGIWLAGNFSDAVQEEVFAQPDVRITVVGAPTGRLTREQAGGYRLTGRWGFNTGCLDAHHAIVGAFRDGGPGGADEDDAVLAIVPYEHLQLADDWDVSGLAGTGSRTIAADDVPLTEEHLWPMAEAGGGITRSARHREDPYWRTIIGPFITANSAGTPLGLAEAALEHYLEGLRPPRPMTLTSYADRGEAAITHLQVGEAATAVEAAAFHARRCAQAVDLHCATGEPYTMLERARIRSDVGRVTGLARTAAHLLWQGSGASAIRREAPIQRIVRDIDALAQHAVMNPDTNIELYGRVLCGLEPHTEAL